MNERRSWAGTAAGVTTFGHGRARRHPAIEKIVRAQRHLWKRRLSVAAKASDHCWACAYPCGRDGLVKAHIHPVRFGGSDEPWNLLLLCHMCHAEQDDDSSRRVQLRWLREHYVSALAPKCFGGML